jgi:hypothetical protein
VRRILILMLIILFGASIGSPASAASSEGSPSTTTTQAFTTTAPPTKSECVPKALVPTELPGDPRGPVPGTEQWKPCPPASSSSWLQPVTPAPPPVEVKDMHEAVVLLRMIFIAILFVGYMIFRTLLEMKKTGGKTSDEESTSADS